MKKFQIICLAFIATGCFSTKLVTPTETDVERVRSEFGSATLAQLTEGKALYEAHCGSCHPMKKPTARSKDEWREIVPDMVQKVNKKKGENTLQSQDEEKILKYVIAMSDAPSDQ